MSQREFASLHDNLGALHAALDAKCLSSNALCTIREVIEVSNKATTKTRECRILAGLRFDRMNERFDDVADAHTTTFAWILRRASNTQSTQNTSDLSTEYLSDVAVNCFSLDNGASLHFTNSFGDPEREGSGSDDTGTSSLNIPYSVSQEPTGNASGKDSDEAFGSNDTSNASISDGDSSLYYRMEFVPNASDSDSDLDMLSEDISDEMSHARDTLVEWLTHGSKIYHVSGKPGSGKSTLMKYLWGHEHTRQYLEKWAETKVLVLSKYFFWKPGSSLQKSLKGLVRGLLFSIVSVAPKLIPVIFPKQWDTTLTSANIAFDSHAEIHQAFLALINCDEAYVGHKFALFIDGLDEFEGNHAEMVKLLLHWADLQPDNVKICVSSRDWAVFHDLFQPFPRIRLHELTRHDILKVVKSTLDTNQNCLEMGLNGEKLQRQIVQKSAGVFLWVTLILRDVEEGLRSGDSLAVLEAKIDSLPTELEDLFWQLLKQIHRVDQRDAYATLTVALQCPNNWPMIRFVFLEDYLKEPEFAMSKNWGSTDRSDVTERLEKFPRKIYGKFKGLLEVGAAGRKPSMSDDLTFKHTVKLTHRSIVEFLRSEEVGKMIEAQLTGFGVFDAMRHTFLAYLGVIEWKSSYLGLTTADAESCLYESRKLFWAQPFPSLENDLLNIIDGYKKGLYESNTTRICAFLARTIETIEGWQHSNMSNQLPMLAIGPFRFEVCWQDKVALMTACHGIPDFLLQTVNHCSACTSTRVAVLSVALGLTAPDTLAESVSITETLDAYFGTGLTPNESLAETANGYSCWQLALMQTCRIETRCNGEKWHGDLDKYWCLPLIAFFISKGADPRIWLCFRNEAKLTETSYMLSELEHRGQATRTLPVFSGDFDTYAISSSDRLREYIQRNGPDISLRTLVGWWFGDFARPIQDAIDWMLERGGLVTADQRRELNELFAPSLRPLITVKAAERLRQTPRDHGLPMVR
ncbi:hypothetical protein BDW74DRAFT_175046 [Aspergillus multicolor]|uniref:uncharacterized protein n=1 Tax=Aspergillus multicolor TaxID=41759 RepID=UPI003CCCBDAD